MDGGGREKIHMNKARDGHIERRISRERAEWVI